MRTTGATILDLSTLPEQARQEVTDFYLFLKKKYGKQSRVLKGNIETSTHIPSDDKCVGMWKDRTDICDAAEWVREQRQSAWSRHE